LIVILSLLFALLPAKAQEPESPVIRVNARLVQLSVLVRDKKGHPVRGLTREDFQVFDNGREQKLAVFSVGLSHPIPGGAQPSASPLTITNRLPHQSETPATTTVILFDESNGPYEEGAVRSARLEVLKFLKTLQPGEQVALYALRRVGVVVVHDFTGDAASVAAAAKTLGSSLLTGIGTSPHQDSAALESQRAIGRSMRDWMRDPGRRNEGAEGDLARAFVMDSLQAIAHHLEGIAGRKNLVWITPSVPATVTGLDPGAMAADRNAIDPPTGRGQLLSMPAFSDPQNHYTAMRAFARLLSDANLAVYPIDAKGLMGPLHVSGGGADSSVAPTRPAFTNSYEAEWGAMDLLASETGGRAVYNTNDIGGHIREIVDETNGAYLLGYYPREAAWDGSYHKLEVKVKGDGLAARCRKGYFATDSPLDRDSDQILRQAASSWLEASAIGITLNVESNPLEWYTQDVVVRVDSQDLHFEERGGRWRANIALVFVQLAKDGRILGGGIKDDILFALHPETLETTMAQGWFHQQTVHVNPEAAKLRVVVRDVASGATGSVSVPIRRR
jgi:VWFA-related protein